MTSSDVICRKLNLYDARKRQSRNLFGGMRHRLSVAMACVGNPNIVILNKPTTRLDPVSQRQVGVALFIGYQGNHVAIRVLVDVIRYFLSFSLFFTACVLVGVGGDKVNQGNRYKVKKLIRWRGTVPLNSVDEDH